MRLPFAYPLLSKLYIVRHGDMDNYNYALGVFQKHYKAQNIKTLEGKTILEFGVGDSILTGIIGYFHGCEDTILIDSGYYIKTDVNHYKLAIEHFAKVLNKPKVDQTFKNIDELLRFFNISYLTKGTESFKEIKDNSIDFCFSQAVLEHIYSDEIELFMRELHRVMKSDFPSTHQVDLKDHLESSLNNLKFSKKIWESQLFKTSGFYTNRINKDRMLNIFESAGFKPNILSATKWDELPIPADSIHQDIKPKNIDTLLTSDFMVSLAK